MVSFDAAKKIALIKEVRSLLNLGLKESKELVEKVPVELLKNVKKEDINPIKEKLEANGAKLEFE
jgi:large subunit ribosomal protein L7/L12